MSKTPAEYLVDFFKGIFEVLAAAAAKIGKAGWNSYKKNKKKSTEIVDGKKVPSKVADEMAQDDMDVSRKDFKSWTKGQQESYRKQWDSLTEEQKATRRQEFETFALPRIQKAAQEYEKAATVDPSKISYGDRVNFASQDGMDVSVGDWKKWTKQQQDAYKQQWNSLSMEQKSERLGEFEKERQLKLQGKPYYYADVYSPSAKKVIEEEQKKMSGNMRQVNEVQNQKNDGKKNTQEEVKQIHELEQEPKAKTSGNAFSGRRSDNSLVGQSVNSYASNAKENGKYTNLAPDHAIQNEFKAENKSVNASNEKVNGRYTNLAPDHAIQNEFKAENKPVNASNEKVNGRYTNLAPQKAQTHEAIMTEEQREAFKEKVKKGAQERKKEAAAASRSASLSIDKGDKAMNNDRQMSIFSK